MSRDRRAGVVCFVLAALALGVTAAVGDSEAPPIRHDEEAYQEVLVFLDAGERGPWIVDYDVERAINGGRRTTSSYTEARDEGIHIVRGGASAEATIGDTHYVCTVTEDDGTLCESSPATETLGAANVVRAAVDSGAYVVTRLPDADIAGEHAQCYQLFGAGGYLPELGAVTEYCFAAGGVELRTKVTTVNDERVRVATKVNRDPSDADLAQVLGELAAEPGSADAAPTN